MVSLVRASKSSMSNNMRQKDIRPAPARIEFKGMKFLITDRPSDHTIQTYILVSVGEFITEGIITWTGELIRATNFNYYF